LREWRYSSTHSLTSALDGGEWPASFPDCFNPKERPPGVHWIRVWVGHRSRFGRGDEEKNSQHPFTYLRVPTFFSYEHIHIFRRVISS